MSISFMPAETGLVRAQFKIRGIAPLILNNGERANPFAEFTKVIKTISTRKKKTEEDLALLANLEWHSAAYVNAKPTINDDYSVTWPDDARLVIPALCIERCIRDGAAARAKGKQVQAGVFVQEDPLIEYEGFKDVNKLSKDEDFILRKVVSVNMKSKVMRVRPIIRDWALSFTAEINPDVMDPADLVEAVRQAGVTKGLGDWRPRHGRFSIESAEEV
jgi:hypothetical protein